MSAGIDGALSGAAVRGVTLESHPAMALLQGIASRVFPRGSTLLAASSRVRGVEIGLRTPDGTVTWVEVQQPLGLLDRAIVLVDATQRLVALHWWKLAHARGGYS